MREPSTAPKATMPNIWITNGSHSTNLSVPGDRLKCVPRSIAMQKLVSALIPKTAERTAFIHLPNTKYYVRPGHNTRGARYCLTECYMAWLFPSRRTGTGTRRAEQSGRYRGSADRRRLSSPSTQVCWLFLPVESVQRNGCQVPLACNHAQCEHNSNPGQLIRWLTAAVGCRTHWKMPSESATTNGDSRTVVIV